MEEQTRTLAQRFSDLRVRILSASVLAVVGALAIWAGGIWFTSLVAILAGAIAWEWRSVTHHGGGRHSAWVLAAPGRQARMVRTAPDRFFVPPYVGPSGWFGVWLDDVCDWDELADILTSAHALAVAKGRPKRKGAV